MRYPALRTLHNIMSRQGGIITGKVNNLAGVILKRAILVYRVSKGALELSIKKLRGGPVGGNVRSIAVDGLVQDGVNWGDQILCRLNSVQKSTRKNLLALNGDERAETKLMN